ncbi:MAG TPA: GGDEF domain-containing protein [Phycisphaerae bacterium]|nr:GGDEF domain-containing protein [Phycisphaerae bacterium]
MSRSGDILLLADEATGREFRGHLGPRQCAAVEDAYDALFEMGRRRWPTVVLTAPRADFPGLCRAARRLQRDARLYAVCPPAGEPLVRPLVGEALDDYFVHPLTRAELRRLAGGAAVPSPAELARAAGDGPAAARQIARLFEAADSVAGLEACLAETVRAATGAAAEWTDVDRAPAGADPLLLMAGEPPRVLSPRGPLGPSDGLGPFLAMVQQALPALARVARRTETLARLAVTDHLTGLYNRRHFYQRTDEVLAEAGQKGFRATVLLYDIDDFKRYNDTYGHAAGDEILRDTAALMRRITRSSDIVARIGGDEFAVLFWEGTAPRHPGSRPPEDAVALADRFRLAVHAHLFASLGPDALGKLSISGGLAGFPRDGRTVRELLRQADRALHEAKASGKNAVLLVGSENGRA